ncbi:MAG TPA: aldehyde dehydrogenase family protein [Ignavibacteriaceae bacterium]|nr:aldehyde dehydrogenase family protein [Ignavibacteriaceae bacterium]
MSELKQTKSINPATLEVIGFTEENSIDDLLNAIEKCKRIQPEWARKSFKERNEYLFKIRDFIVDNADLIADTISKDSGKTKMDALSTEVFPATMALTYYCKTAPKVLRRKKLKAGSILLINKRSYIDRVPWGIVGIISPWNYPFAIPFHEIIMALVAGNAVILKVATQTLQVGKIIQQCIDAAGLPDGLFHLLNIPGNIAGDSFIGNGINKIFFTGSVPVGKKLMKSASEKLLPLSLELGGNDAMIVCSDANLFRAVSGALWAGLSNSGQSCAGVERIYVDTKIYNEFIILLKKQIVKLRHGADTGFNVDIGSLTTENQLKTVKEHVLDAEEKGALVSTFSNPNENNPGLFHPLTIIENVTDEMLVMKEETFGPVIAISKFNTIEEAITNANNSNLGLTASIWTEDKEKAHSIASRIEAGAITINDHLMSHGLAETPWGGFKQSGLGRTHSYLGLEEMTQPRVVVDDIMPGVQKNMWWYPHSKSIYDGLKGAMEFLYSNDIMKRLTGLVKLTKVFLRSFSKNG